MATMAQRETGKLIIRMLQRRGDNELAFTEAARWGVESEVERFLSEGIDVNWQGDDGGSALMKAAFAGEFAIVRRLIDCGADARASCHKGLTALHYAVSGHNPESRSKKVAMILLGAGADTSAVVMAGRCPRDFAEQRYSEEYVALLS